MSDTETKNSNPDKDLIGSALDLFGSPFGSAFPGGFSGSSSATSSIASSSEFNAGSFNVSGQGGSASGAPVLGAASFIVLAMIAGAIYLAGRK